MINESIAKLVKYGENAGLVSGLDKIYATNRILEVIQISDYEEPEQIPETPDLEETLNELLDDAAKRGLLEHNSVVYRDLFDTKLMDCLMPRPGEVVKKFEEMCIRDRRKGNVHQPPASGRGRAGHLERTCHRRNRKTVLDRRHLGRPGLSLRRYAARNR